MALKNFGRQMVSKWSVITDHLETIYRPMTLKNFGRQMVSKWSADQNFSVGKWSVNGRKIGGNGLSVNGREMVGNLPTN